MQELIHAHATQREGGVLPGLLVHLNLPEPTLQIHTREVSGAHHAFHFFPAYVAGDRRPFWYGRSSDESRYRTEATHLFFSRAQQHCTRATERVRKHRRPAFPGYAGAPCPPKVGQYDETFL